MKETHFKNAEERDGNNIKFILCICVMFLCFINLMIHIGVGNIELTISLIAIIESAVGLLLYFALTMLNMLRKNSGFSTSIKGWKTKSSNEKILFIFEFIYVIASFITFISIMELFAETSDGLGKIALYTIIVVINIVLRFSNGYEKVAYGMCSNLIMVLSIGAFLAMCVYANSQAWNTCMQKESFVFKNSDEFEKCKKFYNKKEPGYIVLESGNNTAQVRSLTDEYTEVYFAESDSEFQQFIQNNTMGIGVNVPVLSGNCTFDGDERTVTYEPVFSVNDLISAERKIFTNQINKFLEFEAILLFGILLLVNRSVKKEKYTI